MDQGQLLLIVSIVLGEIISVISDSKRANALTFSHFLQTMVGVGRKELTPARYALGYPRGEGGDAASGD